MAVEIERKWVIGLDELDMDYVRANAYTGIVMEQGYIDTARHKLRPDGDTLYIDDLGIWLYGNTLPESLDGMVVRFRIRQENGITTGEMTFKSATGGLTRREETFAIDVEEAVKLRPYCYGILKKERFKMKEGAHIVELDVYDRGYGLDFAIMEVEFASEEEARAYALPEPWKSKAVFDVSDRAEFYNSSLSAEKPEDRNLVNEIFRALQEK